MGVPPAAIAAALVLCCVVVAFAAWRWWPRASAMPTDDVRSEAAAPGADAAFGAAPSAEATPAGESGPASSTVYVHVVGAVRHPGMYELPGGARVADAVEAAGGLSGNAAQAGVNLARAVSDGEQIGVPTLDEFASGGASLAAPATGGGATAGAGTSAGALVNINAADVAALDTLPGVGPSTAAKIVADREANGPFASPDDLGRVTGIGPKKLEELKPLVSVR